MTDPLLLVLTPYGKDASMIVSILQREGIGARAVSDIEALAMGINESVGAVLVAEEALRANLDLLATALDHQLPWSDLPILLLTRSGAASPLVERIRVRLGNAVLLDRPIRISTLISTVRTALRARARQYQTRAHLLALEEADRRKDEFLATLAHELRNPLAPIRNSVEILKRLPDLPSRLDLPVRIIERQVVHLTRLVGDLLDISRITRGVVALQRAPVLLDSVLEQVAQAIGPLCADAGHGIEFASPPDPIWLDVDAIRIVQVLTNLLNNAIKYTDRGGLIRCEASVDEIEPSGFGEGVASLSGQSLISIRITDSGIGIDRALLPRVFDLFIQADGKDRRSQGGLGIGLTLVRTIGELHGGTVDASSPGLSQGSVFTVRLPRHHMALASEQSPAAGDN